MIVNVQMSSFSPDAKAARIVRWLVAPGAFVLQGDFVAEIETDKAVMDVLAPDTGVISELLFAEGETADIGAPIARLRSGEAEFEQLDEEAGAADKVSASPDAKPVLIRLPALSPSMEAAKLVRWLIEEGSAVTKGLILAEVETDKATLEIEATEEGTLLQILVEAGTDEIKVGTPIAAIGAAAALSQVALDEPQLAEPSAPAISTYASPLAKRVATQLGIDLDLVDGTGPKGRVIRADVEAAAEAINPSATPKDAMSRLFEACSFESVPHDGMRKTIARRLVESKQTIPHFYISAECRIDALLALRGQLNDAAPKEGAGSYKLSVNDLIIKAHALALRDNPDANVSWTDSAMMKHRGVDVGVAVSIPGGLITPIVRDAHAKSVATISREMKDLASRARNRQLKPNEYQGGTTSVSNLGMFGVDSFSAIINPPHATILAVGAGNRRAVVEGDTVVSGTVMSVTLSTDHRAVDGALAAEVLKSFKSYIENPLSIIV